MTNQARHIPKGDVAILGASGRFPGASTIDKFWNNVCHGVESITYLTDRELESVSSDDRALRDPSYVGAAGILKDVELFDASFFGMSAREAELMDPQQRVFLECCWEALERAGYVGQSYNGAIGVYAGARINTYLLNNLIGSPCDVSPVESYSLIIPNEKDYLATRVSYALGLTGPSMTVQTACSTSLVAVHTACQSLLCYECDMALAGGISVRVPQEAGYHYKPDGVRSADGHTRSFDAKGTGTVFGSGAGVIVLKRLDDALSDRDHIHAVIKGTSINNDGASKTGFTAPSVEGQAKVIKRALEVAGVNPRTIGLIEAHGTATSKGDPVEIAALTSAFGKCGGNRQFCAIGSVKSNVGHLDVASGVTGLIKAALALERKVIPPTLYFDQPNPQIDFENSPFFVNTKCSDWEQAAGPRRAGVSSFGFGGTNAHVVLQEAPDADPAPPSRPWNLLVFSAKTASALDNVTDNLAEHFRQNPHLNLDDVAFTLQAGRQHFAHRRTLVCRSVADALSSLQATNGERTSSGISTTRNRPIAFMFPGHGSQHINMARDLYENESTFRADVENCAELLSAYLERDLRDVLYPTPKTEVEATHWLNQTIYTQPALFVTEYALARLWMRLGITPSAMVGYSIGEYVAACLAGVFTLPDALKLITARASLMQSRPGGAMLAVALSEELLNPYLGDGVSISAFSGPQHCIVGGPIHLVEELTSSLEDDAVATRRLIVSHAFHSAMMEPILHQYREAVQKISLQTPQIPYVSSVTGTWIRDVDTTDPEFWVREVRQPLLFSQAIEELADQPDQIFLECGPSNALTTLVRSHPAVTAEQVALASSRHPRDQDADTACLLNTLGKLWLAGVAIDWQQVSGPGCRRVPLPTYPFQRQRYWIDRRPRQIVSAESQPAPSSRKLALVDWDARSSDSAIPQMQTHHRRPSLSTKYVAPDSPLQQEIAGLYENLLGISRVGIHDSFFELGGNSLVAVQLMSRVRDAFFVEVPLVKFLARPTVSQLAQDIAEAQAYLQEGPEIDRILDDIEGQPIIAESASQPVANNQPLRLSNSAAANMEQSVRQSVGVEFDLFFFSADESGADGDKYDLLLEAARFADRHGFGAIWTPERHFHRFGGLYPNPSVLAAALAMITERIRIHAGSVVAPLHDPIRIAEEWAVVDNLSGGRVGVGFAAGYHANDFVMSPDGFANRKQTMRSCIRTVQKLWRGEKVVRRQGTGTNIEVSLFPKPVQRKLPIWLATTGKTESFVEAGKIGANVLTALLLISVDELAERIALYRESLERNGHEPDCGRVTLMLHTFLGNDPNKVEEQVKGPLYDYLRSHLDLISPIAEFYNNEVDSKRSAASDREALLSFSYQRYLRGGSLIGTPHTCHELVNHLSTIGVDEIACLIDFGLDDEQVMDSLRYVNDLKGRVTSTKRNSTCSLQISTE